MFMQEVDKVCNADVKRIKTGGEILSCRRIIYGGLRIGAYV